MVREQQVIEKCHASPDGKVFSPAGNGWGFSRVHAGEGGLLFGWAGLYHGFAEAHGEFGLPIGQLLEDGVDEIADGGGEVMDALSAEVGIQRRGDYFDDLDVLCFQEVAKGEREGVEEGLCGGVYRNLCERGEGEARGDVHHRCEGFVVEEEVGEMDGRFDVDHDFLFRALEEIFVVHIHPVLDAGVVDEDIYPGVAGGDPGVQGFPFGGEFEIAFFCDETGVFRRRIIQDILPSAANNYGVVLLKEARREGQADAGGAAGDEDRIAGELHSVSVFV